MSFLSAQTIAGRDVCAGARIPFISWCGRHPIRGVLVVDLSHPEPFEPTLMADLGLAARKIATALATAGVDGPLSEIDPDSSPVDFLKTASLIFEQAGLRGLSLKLDSEEAVKLTWSTGMMPTPIGNGWCDPVIIPRGGGPTVNDHDSRAWGIQEQISNHSLLLSVPLKLGAQRVGELVAAWSLNETDEDRVSWRAGCIRNIVALWMLWSWSWRDGKSFLDPASGMSYEMERCRATPQKTGETDVAITWPVHVRMIRRRSIRAIAHRVF